MSSRPDRHDSQARADRWRPRALAVWTVVGAFVAAWLVVGALSFVQQALELLLVGGVVGFVCSPITNRLEDAGMPRGAAAFLALLAFLVALVAILALVGGPLLQELVVLLRNVPSYVTQVNQGLQDFWAKVGTSENSNVQNFVNSLVGAASTMGSSMASDLARQVSGGLAANLSALASDFTTFFLGIILAYWFAVDYPRMVRELVRVVGPERGRDVTLILAVLSRSTGGYMRGTLITSIADGLMVAVGLVLVGHPYAGLVGALTFVMHFIPVIGPMLSAVAGTLLGLFVSPACALWTLVIAMVAQNVADNLLSPMVMRSAVKIHPALSLVRDSLAESRAVLAFSMRAGTSLTAGWSSSIMPSSLATIGCVWAMTSFAVDVTSSMDLRAPRTVSATSMTAQIPTSARTMSAMSR